MTRRARALAKLHVKRESAAWKKERAKWAKALSKACMRTGRTVVKVRDPEVYKNRRSERVSHTNTTIPRSPSADSPTIDDVFAMPRAETNDA